MRPASIAEVREVLERFAAAAPWTEADARAWWESRGADLGLAREDLA